MPEPLQIPRILGEFLEELISKYLPRKGRSLSDLGKEDSFFKAIPIAEPLQGITRFDRSLEARQIQRLFLLAAILEANANQYSKFIAKAQRQGFKYILKIVFMLAGERVPLLSTVFKAIDVNTAGDYFAAIEKRFRTLSWKLKRELFHTQMGRNIKGRPVLTEEQRAEGQRTFFRVIASRK